ncbi:MarR family winged helix-turn-helix transcriptional regulator [uncultured Jatrophihabitans sp.]|uniref:MarR family winged helix-turn-helix transcriptional regulator n=1 Tax=uncultured Jatrophihabitans sp. TaxID=1610747 RepID=UPI0035C9AD2C
MTGTTRAGDDMAVGVPTRWLTDDEQAAWRAFLTMKTQLDAQLGRDMQDEGGLSMADFAVLVPLSEHPDGRMRILELARGLQWEKSRLSHQLTRMQQRGLIERSNCCEDRRGAFVVLTDAGASAVRAAAPRHVEAVRRYLFDVLSPEQVVALGDISRAVQHRLAEQGTGAEPGETSG